MLSEVVKVKLGMFKEVKEHNITRTSILREECKRQKQGQNSSYQLTQVLIYSLNSTDLIIENCLTELDGTDRKLISLLYT